MNDAFETLPYCGMPAEPANVWTSWNLDPWLLGASGAALAAYLWGRRRSVRQGDSRREDGCFYLGWTIALLALVSPLCSLSVALFSARVAQHVVLTLIAAPLLVLARPERLFANAARKAFNTAAQGRVADVLASGRTAWAAFLATLWFWHAPGPYGVTFTGATAYWLMHLSLLLTAAMLWRALLVRYRNAPICALACGLAAAVQMGLLGALLTFARRPLYAEHWDTTVVWGMTALEDQQLGGLIMWVPGCSVFLVVAVAALAAWWRDSPTLSDGPRAASGISHQG